MEAFGFRTIRANGQDEESISDAIDEAKAVKDSAVCIVMDTVKAQGVLGRRHDKRLRDRAHNRDILKRIVRTAVGRHRYL